MARMLETRWTIPTPINLKSNADLAGRMELIVMCDCKGIETGSYDNTILLGYHETMREYRDNRKNSGLPENGICVDRCLMDEVMSLWDAGIRTYGCCCGHNKVDAYINVDEADFDKAIRLGWIKYTFENDHDRRDTIIPKSIAGRDSAIESIEDHMAYACDCGSVHFNLLKSGKIECSSCEHCLEEKTW